MGMVAFKDKRYLFASVVVTLFCAAFLAFVPSSAMADTILPEVDFDASHHASYDVELNADVEGIDDKIKEALEANAATEVKGTKPVLKFVEFDSVFDYFSLGDIVVIQSHDNRIIGNFWCWITGAHQDHVNEVAPTCTTHGYEWSVCQSCDRLLFRPIPALGHSWSDPVWTWVDDPLSATATFTCKNNPAHVKDVVATISTITMEDGSVKYVATATLGDKSFTDNHVPGTVNPAPHEHEWSEPTWEWATDHLSATATFTCKGDSSHTQEIAAEVVQNEPEGKTITYVATVTFEDKVFTDKYVAEVTDPTNPPQQPGDPDTPNKPNPPTTDPDDPNQGIDDTNKPSDGDNQNPPSDPDENDRPTVDLIVGSDPIIANVGADGKVDIKIDGVPGDFVISVDGAPQGNMTFAVRKVTAGPVYDALSSAVAEASLGHEITGIFDIDLTVNGQHKSEDFGSLTLSFPVSVEHNNKWATVFHCHNNDTSNISSYESVLTRDGKVYVKGVKNLSTFAVAVGDRAVAKQISQVNMKTRITRGLVQPVQAEVKRPQVVSESETLTHSVAGPVEALAESNADLPDSGLGAQAVTSQAEERSHHGVVVAVGTAIAALMTLLVALIVFARKRNEM